MSTPDGSSGILVKSFAEAEATVQRELRADRGLLTNRLTLLVLGIGIVGATITTWLPLVATALLLTDFAVFIARRWRTLRTFRKGSPRLTTSADFARIDEAFKNAGHEQPSMTDYE